MHPKDQQYQKNSSEYYKLKAMWANDKGMNRPGPQYKQSVHYSGKSFKFN